MKRHGIISAGHEDTADAGIQMLESGGNAFDAALAAMLASFVSENSLTSMGGGGFMTTFTSEKKSTVFDFFVQTPQKRHPMEEMDFRETSIDFGNKKQYQYSGKGSVAVPGCAAGLFHIHRRLGSLPMKEVMRPAIELARKGVVITSYQAYSLKILEPILMEKPESAVVFGKNGQTFGEGEMMKLPLFADALEALEKGGVDVFYKGEIGQRFAADNRENGGSVSLEDLMAYEVIERRPHSYEYRGHTLLTNPPPSAGGSLIAHGLKLMAAAGPSGSPAGTAYVEQLVRTMQGMDTYRESYLTPMLNALGNTTHISVMDDQGNAASLTTTVGGASGEIIPGTGIQTNNMLGELDLFPGGVYQWPENKRVSSMMSPSIVLFGGNPNIVLGSGGSSRIRTAILQVLLNLIDHNMKVKDAVSYPRIHWEGGSLSLEPGLLEDHASLDLAVDNLERWDETNMFFGGVHTVMRSLTGQLTGGADARRAGVVKMC